jgi:cell division protein FtsL
VGVVAIVCILSILFLAQTGRVATARYRLQELEREHARLTHDAEQYEYRIAKASRLDVVTERAQRLGLRPATGEQLRYATIELPAVPMVASTAER